MVEVSAIGWGNAYISSISAKLYERSSSTEAPRSVGGNSAGADTADISSEAQQKLAEESSGGSEELSEDAKKEVDHLKQRDVEVRQHEQAHMAAGGSLVRGGVSFTYETGPDGKRYAVGGEVSIDCSPVDGDPQATIRKAQQVQKAASAPAQPSGQDRSVAAEAAAMELKARRELSQQGSGTQRSGLSVAA